MKLQMRKIMAILFVATYMCLSFTDAIYVSHDRSSAAVYLKYITMILTIVVGGMLLLYKRPKEYVFTSQLCNYGVIIVTFLVISLIKALFVGKFAEETILELVNFILSISFAFVILNILSFKQIDTAFRCILVSAFFAYLFFEIGISKFSYAALYSISYSDSYSPFESSFSAGMAITLCMYFCYYRKSKVFTILSAVFVALTFKRIAVLYAIILLIIPRLFEVDKVIKKGVTVLCKLVFIISTIGYYVLLLPSTAPWVKDTFGIDISKFTMGRNGFLSRLLDSNYVSYGYGSSIDFNGRNIEMDLIRILVELGIVGLIVYVNCFWNLAKGHVYCMMVCFYAAVTELFSHDLGHSFQPALYFIIIGCILYKEKAEVSGRKYRGKRKRKKIKVRVR